MNAPRQASWALVATAMLGSGALFWSMALTREEAVRWPFWMLIGLISLGLAYLLWQAPQSYAVLAASMTLGLPMAGTWEAAGRWIAAVLMGVAALRWLITHLQKGQQWNTAFIWPLLFTGLWLGWGIVAAAGSPEPLLSWTISLQLAATAMGGLACGHWIRQDRKALSRWILLAALGMGMLEIRSLSLFDTLAKAAPEPYWLDANYFSAGIALLLPLLVWLMLHKAAEDGIPAKVMRIASGILLGIMLIGVAWLDSRGAWLSIVGAGFALPLLLLRRMKMRLLWLMGIVLLGFVIFLALPKPQNGPGTHKPLDRVQSITNMQDFSNRERIIRWTCAWRMAVDKPVLGQGPGRFAPIFKNFLQDRNEVNQISWWFGWRFGAHSDSLTTLAESGFPGLLLFVLMIGSWAWQTFKVHFPIRPPRSLIVAVVASLLTWLIHGFFNDLLTNPCIVAWVFLLMGILASPAKNEPFSVPVRL